MNKLRRILRVLGVDPSIGLDYYECLYYGHILPKQDAKVSGYDSQSSLRHVHCPKCGKIITHTP